VLVRSDHLLEQYGPLTVLATVARGDRAGRVGHVRAQRRLRANPAVLAQELASLDVLSGGRLEVAMGAGWNQPEYAAMGAPFDPVPTRVSRLAEAVAGGQELLRATARSRTPASTTGFTDTTATRSRCSRPHPPLFLGGGAGARCGWPPGRRTSSGWHRGPATRAASRARPTEEKIGWVREAAGERFDTLELNVVTRPAGR
jgi:alkanesulfonate monooxygenase SsuD/methylene tetrahydromethanopterin reductase-like flavin-dependent oxidoreductase (luciferase family)